MKHRENTISVPLGFEGRGVSATTNPCSPQADFPKSICPFISSGPNDTLRERESPHGETISSFTVGMQIRGASARGGAFDGNSWTRITPQARTLKASGLRTILYLHFCGPPDTATETQRARWMEKRKNTPGAQKGAKTFTAREKGLEIYPGDELFHFPIALSASWICLFYPAERSTLLLYIDLVLFLNILTLLPPP